MKFIKKGPEPERLQRYRREPYASYEGYPFKDELRDVLAREQGFLCCYCMSRISADAGGMKIEHWLAQSPHPESALDYANMLAACRGGDGHGVPRSDQHCDTRKGKDNLTIRPTDPACERKISYGSNGESKSEDPAVQRDLDETLNLNLSRLKRNRRQALDDAIAYMQRQKPEGTWPRSLLEREQARWSQRNGEGKYMEYCRVVLYWIERRLQRAGGS
jgi:uncharacterized protein (TIGR02646 family)